jgi:hypothetical protein
MTKMTIEEIGHVVENEGLGYAIQSYLSADDIQDTRLAELWQQAKDILDEIDEILGVDE